ncbi:NADPH-dependent F420 reductase [Desertivirga xinjiangensis]|uniref:NADPH-dependent F420 reductase n=1 Tax=Desertivirga xinjiangensis TaxID=539206 RepID=UPI0021088DAE|nr:NADPH-dependent F420 reductase [Pedobacter xinjiangensis]
MKTTFGIIGAGNIGKTVAAHLLKAGHSVILSNSRDPESLSGTIAELGAGAKAGTSKEAAEADIVLLALPWSQLSTLSNLTDWTNRIVIDATNHFITYAPEFRLADLGGRASSEVVADFVPGAKVVKAFNTLYFKILEKDPAEANGRRVIFISGNEPAAKQSVSDAIQSTGFAVVDLGDLATASKLQEPKGALATLNLIKN